MRTVEVSDRNRLRLFFLSLLWRAAATSLSEFGEVSLPPADLDRLGQMLRSGTADPLSFYPASLTQLPTMGTIHNMAPIAETKIVPAVGDEAQREVPFFRFYLDGLIAHMHIQSGDDGLTDSLGPLIVGSGEKLAISTVPYESSFERENLANVLAETSSWPRNLAKPPLHEL